MATHLAIKPGWLIARPIAHRGLHDAKIGVIENSISAAKAAITHGFAIECDVQLTKDGEAVVFHDFSLERLTTGKGLVIDQTTQAFANISMRGTSDKVPTLFEFLQLINGQVPLILEIKSLFDSDLRLTQRVAEIVKAHSGPIALKSFDPDIVAALRSLTPDHPRGIVAMTDYEYPDYAHMTAARKHSLANLLHFDETKPDFISWRVRDLPSAAPYLCRSAIGLPLMTWTVRSEEDRMKASTYADQMVFEGFVPEAQTQ